MSRFPRTAAVVEATALAAELRAAAHALDQLAGSAVELEPSTLRRRLRAVRIEVVNQLDGLPQIGEKAEMDRDYGHLASVAVSP